MRLIDLSVPLNEQTPVYPGDPKIKIEPAGVLTKDGYEDHYLSIGTHVGTHIDAPRHMLKNGGSLDQFPLEKFVGRGVMIKTGRKIDLETVRNAAIREDDMILFNTGMSKVYHYPEYYDNYPAITEEIANYLVDKKIKMVGVDMCSVDHEPFPVHKILLKEEILIVENLTNLDELDGKDFTIFALPIKLQIDGAPARVIAKIQSKII